MFPISTRVRLTVLSALFLGSVAIAAVTLGPAAIADQEPAGAHSLAAISSATKTVSPAGNADPGDTLTYTVTLTNDGTATSGVKFFDELDPNTTLVPNSLKVSPIAVDDAYNVIGNVQIQPDATGGVLANDINPVTNSKTGLSVTPVSGGTSAQGGNISIAADGSFSYNPAAGFTGTDTFTYTVKGLGDASATAIITFKVGNGTSTPGTNVVWFVKAGAAGGGDGRLTSPFNCLVGAGCFSATSLDEAGDTIFLFNGLYTDNAPLTLLNSQKLIGEAASSTLASIAGLSVPTHSDALPTTGGTSPTVQTTGAVTHIIGLGQDNTLRGFTTGDTQGADILGNTFGTLVLGNSSTPDLTIGGAGEALHLTNGMLSLSGRLTSLSSTNASLTGLFLSGVSDSGAGSFNFGSTTITNSTTEGITVQSSTGDFNFGDTNVTGSGGTGVNLGGAGALANSGGLTFADLDIAPDSGQRAFLSDQNTGTITSTSGTIATTGNSGPFAISGPAGRTPLAMALTSVTTTAPTGVGVNVFQVSGNLTIGSTTVSGGAANVVGIQVRRTAAGGTMNFGNTSVTGTNTVAGCASASRVKEMQGISLSPISISHRLPAGPA
jgi:uncharacterized repeat protein (TIGR01451 family)